MTLTIRNSTEQRDDTEARVLALLDAHSDSIGRPFIIEHLAFEAWDGDAFLGGLTARMAQDWIFLALLAVSEDARGKGVGRKLVMELEDWGRERGATGVWLDTFAFQAPDFYKGLGYRLFGELEDSPAGMSRYFFAKRLDSAD